MMIDLTERIRIAVAVLGVAAGVATAQTTQPQRPALPTTAPAAAPELLPGVESLPVQPMGPFVQLEGGRILCVEGDAALASDDGGKTWSRTPIFGDRKMKVRPEQALIRTRAGTLVLAFLDDLDKRWKWDAKANAVDGDVWLYAWVVRSTDGGKTWDEPRKILNGYSGAIRDMLQLRSGNLIVPVTVFSKEGQRHVTVPYVSTDDGVTWTAGPTLDVGGRGHHDGSVEATLVEREDRSVWMLLRTNLDFFYESVSRDDGLTWSVPAKTSISASSAPAMLKRLKDNRLAMAWNRVEREVGEAPPRRGGQHAATMASWHRSELSLAFSSDDGHTWSKPTVIARKPGSGWVSYPYLFEPESGTLWITTMQGHLRARLNIADFAPQGRLGAGR